MERTRVDVGGKAGKELQSIPRGFRSALVEALVELFSEQVGLTSLPITAFSSQKTLKSTVKALLKRKLREESRQPVQKTTAQETAHTKSVDPETLKVLREVQAEEQRWEEMKREEEERKKRLKRQMGEEEDSW